MERYAFDSAEDLLRYLLYHATWYAGCLELDFKAESGCDLYEEAVRLLKLEGLER
jgi:hypothetical protein